jgi:hypothetical protein
MKEKLGELSFLEKAGAVTLGPVLGLLPPRLQMKLSGDKRTAASYMSTSSRITNAVVSAYTLVSLGARLFGADIDPSTNDVVTNAGVWIGADTTLRELFYGAKYNWNHPYMPRNEPWGEPILSTIDSVVAPEWYKNFKSAK